MDGKTLVIVESPTKARTIKRFLPKNFIVEASVGHVRDLPQSASDIPKELKKEEWGRLGIDIDNQFRPLYVIPRGKGKIIRELKKRIKEVDLVLLATDEDREGESISWHLTEVLQPKVPVKRMVFHEITKKAIERALENERAIDMDLVNAQETRRILDRLYGYTLSPLIWKKIAYGLSAGRVQSPGLRLIVQRERERISFVKSVYWDIKAELFPEDEKKSFEAKLESIDGSRIAGGKDFDPATGKLLPNKKNVVVVDEATARSLEKELSDVQWAVSELSEKHSKTRPAPPFITSTLQQEGNRKLRMSARETMRTAQRLYEQGFITYMRTDSPTLSTEALQGARSAVQELYGKEYLSEAPRQYAAKSKGAQEAHEAIRPAGDRFRHPDETGLSGREKSLYTLIWKRTLACQMAEARKVSVTAKIDAGRTRFSATGTRIEFPGFIRVYVEGKDDPEAALDDKETFLPPLVEGQELSLKGLEGLVHETKPPARFTEATLVRELESLGIGRPSTYATIINTLFERQYVRKQGNALVPTFTGFAVVQLLERHFQEMIEYSFTSDMEAALDQIAVGKRDRLDYLTSFYLGDSGLKTRVEHREKAIKPEESRTIDLPHITEGIKVGKYGPYLVQHHDGEEIHASIPEDIAPADLREEEIQELIRAQKNGPEPLGSDPESGEPVYCLTGRYGPYVQLGEKSDENPKPKRAAVPKGVKPSEVSLELALQRLSLPRLLGINPETGKEVLVNDGRFGPYVLHDGEFRSLKKDDDLFTIGLDRALEILAEPKRGRGGVSVLKDFGAIADGGRKVAVYDGKYGPYIKCGAKNIRLPDDKREKEAIEKLSSEEVLEIITTASKAKGKK
ncbi:type I DNA topoisomerase [Sediminispirochaeta bajacaliforniensis]|uniref:type I DNA topoisomerase n=1 Tax=Sediminispirochaeta bajacaliforniensis TaxID=148 RepID=UPI0003707BF5|nr:type I DNA topoisomerase [Sediminispirochaeta bajacaliforniensis]